MKRSERDAGGYEQVLARLRVGAVGDLSGQAAIQLLESAGLVADPGFRLAYVEAAGPGQAVVDWPRAANGAGRFALGPVQLALLSLAASLADPRVVVPLGQVVSVLDQRAAGLLAWAVCHASDNDVIAGALGSWGRG